MRKSQANLSTLAARLPGKPRPRPASTPGTDPALRTLTDVKPSPQAVRNRRSPRLTSTQRDSTGCMSAWARSPYAPRGGWR